MGEKNGIVTKFNFVTARYWSVDNILAGKKSKSLQTVILHDFFGKKNFLITFFSFCLIFSTCKSKKQGKIWICIKIIWCFRVFIKIKNCLFCPKTWQNFIGIFCVDDCPEDKNRSYIYHLHKSVFMQEWSLPKRVVIIY